MPKFLSFNYFAFLRSTIFVKRTPVLVCSTSSLQFLSDVDHDISEQFVTLLYYTASICTGVNQCSVSYFQRKAQ